MNKQVLIADKRVELSTKYKKLIESLGHCVKVSYKLNEVFKIIQDIEPDLIIVSDSLVDNIADFCKKLRVLTFNTRPVIIAISKSAELDDKLNVLENGADDFLSEPIQSQEFKMRIHAHLRREQENTIFDKTGLPNKNYTLKEIKRALLSGNKKAFMLVGIENYIDYKSLYTDLASDKLVQTFCAIIKSSINDRDFLGQISENEFVIITSPLYVEKIASFLNFAFDSVIHKFYSEQDFKRGYIISQGDDKEGRRIEFLKSSIGVITSEFKHYSNSLEVLNSLKNVYKMAIKPSGSSYLIERPQIVGDNSVCKNVFNNNILVLEDDEALSFLLVTTIELQGYKVFTSLKMNDVPSLIILDAGDIDTLSGLQKCVDIKLKFPSSKIIMTSVLHDKEMVLNSGADLYLPKPYNIITLMSWINTFNEEFNKNC